MAFLTCYFDVVVVSSSRPHHADSTIAPYFQNAASWLLRFVAYLIMYSSAGSPAAKLWMGSLKSTLARSK